jgi:hypothetical protein
MERRQGAAEMAAIWSLVRKLSEPIPPRSLAIASPIELTDDPFLSLPWHPEQYWL